MKWVHKRFRLLLRTSFPRSYQSRFRVCAYVSVGVLLYIVVLAGCAGTPFLSPNPPQSQAGLHDKNSSELPSKGVATEPHHNQSTPVEVVEYADTPKVAQSPIIETLPGAVQSSPQDSLNPDFSSVIAKPENATEDTLTDDVPPPVASNAKQSGFMYASPSGSIRVQLKKKVRETMLYSIGNIALGHGDAKRTVKGRIKLVAIPDEYVSIENDGSIKFTLAMPCTLLSVNQSNVIEVGEDSYRGSIILDKDIAGTIMIINLVDIESYLRGVVSLEIGRRSEAEIEAVKAQAIAARTYAYRKMLENTHSAFDLVATVADQVYGGCSADAPVCDAAIKATTGMVLTFHDSLVMAYYHSTCGGRTTAISDAWPNKQTVPYLRSMSDLDKHGQPYCAASNHGQWTDTWKTSRLSSIINTYSKAAFPEDPCKGSLKRMRITDRFSDGRVKNLAIYTTVGTFEYGGDKLRFLLRREMPGFPILRSSWFTIKSGNSSEVVFEGKGNGHGVGMCQMGALGRASAGYGYKDILSAYYPGTKIVVLRN